MIKSTLSWRQQWTYTEAGVWNHAVKWQQFPRRVGWKIKCWVSASKVSWPKAFDYCLIFIVSVCNWHHIVNGWTGWLTLKLHQERLLVTSKQIQVFFFFKKSFLANSCIPSFLYLQKSCKSLDWAHKGTLVFNTCWTMYVLHFCIFHKICAWLRFVQHIG